MDKDDRGYRLRASMTSVMVWLCTRHSRRQILPIENEDSFGEYRSYEVFIANGLERSSDFKLVL